jgi:hypothetical protein
MMSLPFSQSLARTSTKRMPPPRIALDSSLHET